MQPSDEEWVALGRGPASVALAITGPPGYAQPACVRLCAGSHEIGRACELVDPYGFLATLTEAHRSLNGTASLKALERDFELAIAVHPEGQTDIKAKIGEHFGGPVEWTFDVRFSSDQSYLPTFIQAFRAALNRADQ